MRVIIAYNTTQYVYLLRTRLIQNLQRAGCVVYVVAPRDTYVEKMVAIGCQHIDVDVKRGVNPLRDIYYFIKMVRVIKSILPHYYLGYTIKPNTYGSLACRMCGVPVINNISGLGSAFLSNGILSLVARFLYRLSLTRSKVIFFQNPDDQNEFITNKLIKSHQARLLPGSGVDLDRYKPLTRSTPFKSGQFTILFVGRLMLEKGIIEFIEAAKRIKGSYSNVSFRIGGSIPPTGASVMIQTTINDAVKAGILTYLGFLEDVRSAIADSDCVCLPSYREGTPRALIEAAAMGKPLIATDAPGCREIVREGRNGFLCRVGDPLSLAKAIERMITSGKETQQQMGAQSREIAEQEYDERIVIEAYLQAMKLSDGDKQMTA